MKRESLPHIASLETQLQEARLALEARTRELAEDCLGELIETIDQSLLA